MLSSYMLSSYTKSINTLYVIYYILIYIYNN